MKEIYTEKENIEMLISRLEEYKTFQDEENEDRFDEGYSKGWRNAFDDAIYLVKLYILNDFDE